MQNRVYLSALFILFCFKLSSQVYEGGSFNLGFAVGQASNPNYERLFQEYNETRPWLDRKADLLSTRYGFSMGIAGSEDRLLFGFNLSGFKTATSVHGIDTNGHELVRTYILKNSGFEMMYGILLVNHEKFRLAPLFGIAFYNAVLRYSDKNAAQRWGQTALRILFLRPSGSNVRTVDDHFFMGARFGVTAAFGEKNALAVEPFYVLPFWKVNALKTRNLVNEGTSTYPDSDFKSYISQWGIRISYCIGLKKK